MRSTITGHAPIRYKDSLYSGHPYNRGQSIEDVPDSIRLADGALLIEQKILGGHG